MEKRATRDQRSGPHSPAKITLEYALVLLQRKYTCGSKAVASTLELKEKRRETMSVTEVNAIRYASGYVVTKLPSHVLFLEEKVHEEGFCFHLLLFA